MVGGCFARATHPAKWDLAQEAHFVLHNCILVFDYEQVYFKLQVTNLKNKEVTVNSRPQTLEKIGFSKTLLVNTKP